MKERIVLTRDTIASNSNIALIKQVCDRTSCSILREGED